MTFGVDEIRKLMPDKIIVFLKTRRISTIKVEYVDYAGVILYLIPSQKDAVEKVYQVIKVLIDEKTTPQMPLVAIGGIQTQIKTL